MPRRKADPEPEEEPREPGLVLPPIEEFIRKMSTKFSSEDVLSSVTVEDVEEEDEAEEESDED